MNTVTNRRLLKLSERSENTQQPILKLGIEPKFWDALRSKTETAQINEALLKVLCHNICCLIQSMYELNLKPKFWAEVA